MALHSQTADLTLRTHKPKENAHLSLTLATGANANGLAQWTPAPARAAHRDLTS